MKYLFVLFLFPSLLFGQSIATGCGHTRYLAQDATTQQYLSELDDVLGDAQFGAEASSKRANYLLPIVVHLVQHKDGVRISDEQVLQGIADLNAAFANQGAYKQGSGVDTDIQFELAKRTPEGNATSGITRTISNLSKLRFQTSDDRDLKALTYWNSKNYINIWLIDEIIDEKPCGGGVSGYASAGNPGSQLDGIVCEARWFGTSTTNSVLQVHEMGHYLSLYHTFEGGCSNEDCAFEGDRICDTPPDRWNFGNGLACHIERNSCSTDVQSGFSSDQPDMISNFMDYEDAKCQHDFTEGQAVRMQAFIERKLQPLLRSNALKSPCNTPLHADFSVDKNIAIVGEIIRFDYTGAASTDLEWSIDGEQVGTSTQLQQTFNETGIFTIRLSNRNADCTAVQEQQIRVICEHSTSFNMSQSQIRPGEIVSFESNTIAEHYKWLRDNTFISDNPEFDYGFPHRGNFLITLETTTGGCTSTQSQYLYVGTRAMDGKLSLRETDKDYCAGDRLKVRFQLCNQGYAPIPAQTPITFFQDNPLRTRSNVLKVFHLPDAVSCCDTFTVFFTEINTPLLNIHAIFNVEFELNNYVYLPLSNLKDVAHTYESNYNNNYTEAPITFQGAFWHTKIDSSLCWRGDSLLLRPTDFSDSIHLGASYQWNTGETTSSLNVTQAGIYETTISNCGFKAKFIFEIDESECSCRFRFPNVFTPNNDGLNDTFGLVYLCDYEILEYDLKIYNRWGEMVFQTQDIDHHWTAEGQPSDSYTYILGIKELYKGREKYTQEVKSLTLVR